MSPCERTLEWLLEADPSELEVPSVPEPASHLRSCAGCRAALRRLVESHEALDAVLGSAPPVDARAIVARARLDPVEGRSDARETVPAGRDRRLPRRWLAVATAAAIGTVLLLADGERPLPGTPPEPSDPAAYALVEASAGHDVAVIPTDDPDITVLWFF